MIYYRTHASRSELQPPELVGWRSPHHALSICSRQVDCWRVVGIADPMYFDVPPDLAFEDIGNGWFASNDGKGVDLAAHRRTVTTWPCETIEVPNVGPVTCPKVLDKSGQRLFPVKYGRGFQPVLTAEQTMAEAHARGIQDAFKSGNWPDMTEQAKVAADLMCLTHALSPATVAMGECLDAVAVQLLNLLAADCMDQ